MRHHSNPHTAATRLGRVAGAASLAVLVIGLAGCSVFGIRTAEEAAYTVLRSDGEIEVREYDEHVVAQTLVEAPFDEAARVAFERLFGYISGDNAGAAEIAMTAPVLADPGGAGEQIAMTAPVSGERAASGWRYRFVLPAGYSAATAPVPVDPEVAIAAVPASRVAALRYSGSWSESNMRRNTARLLDWVEANGLEAVSQPRSAGYDPPWTLPFLRRNEILVDVE